MRLLCLRTFGAALAILAGAVLPQKMPPWPANPLWIIVPFTSGSADEIGINAAHVKVAGITAN